LVASKLSPDSVLSYHTAFEILGFANQVFTTTYYSSLRYKRPFSYQGIRYVCVRLPNSLKSNPFFGVVGVERMGMFVRVTSAERTLAECLDRPEYCGGFEEAIRCISSLPFVDEELLGLLEREEGGFVWESGLGFRAVKGKAFHHGRFPTMA
jgi:predicted transcriptional regulator of viral defense system